tara:strand:- start:124 stop:588 length:465 start_codon:yes stop_codon:yes gene_type:complete
MDYKKKYLKYKKKYLNIKGGLGARGSTGPESDGMPLRLPQGWEAHEEEDPEDPSSLRTYYANEKLPGWKAYKSEFGGMYYENVTLNKSQTFPPRPPKPDPKPDPNPDPNPNPNPDLTGDQNSSPKPDESDNSPKDNSPELNKENNNPWLFEKWW